MISTAIRIRLAATNEEYFTDLAPPYCYLRVGQVHVPCNADQIFGPAHSQESVFEYGAKSLSNNFLKGMNDVSYVAVGPPGSGKTYTLFGPGSQLTDSSISFGIFQRFATHTFSQVQNHFKYITCKSAKRMIDCLNHALSNRQHIGHMVADIVLTQPNLEDDCRPVTTSVLFVDVDNLLFNTETHQIQEDLHILTSLLSQARGEPPQISRFETPLYRILQNLFDGQRCSLIFFCISPSFNSCTSNAPYIALLSSISELKYTNVNLRTQCENQRESQQEHPVQLLECIEEVTESEEEIASSNGKMSESLSQDNSLSESDREDGDVNMCQLSDNNFSNSLNVMCDKFNMFVDKFVDSFKAKTSLSPVKERKHDYSSTRRGGLALSAVYPPLVNIPVQPVQVVTRVEMAQPMPYYQQTQTGAAGASNHRTTETSTGCIRKTTTTAQSSQTSKERKDQSGKKRWDLEPHEFDESQISKDKELLDFDLEHITQRLNEEKKSLLDIMRRWESFKNQMKSSKSNGNEHLARTVETERKTNMQQGVKALATTLSTMKSMFKEDFEGSSEFDPMGFCNYICDHRRYRHMLVTKKNELEACIKDKTATEEEIRYHISVDEMIALIDSCIEFLSCLMQNEPIEHKLAKTVGGFVMKTNMEKLTTLEVRHLLYQYFTKVVDLRENSKQMENTIKELEGRLDYTTDKMKQMMDAINTLRAEKAGRLMQETHQPHLVTLDGDSRQRRIPETKASTIPAQNLNRLQVTKAPPPAKVTITHNKLIIEKSSKERN
ncbi:uncharacterized protein LOC128997769 isoform X2 [Macrosteles quadrilineatus]|uniref:uncharacterized protein LOC128997769 isoform X2 n=1 Tax=Macrosteles quadrilineatus TaxID=74068 RepID=UPI0023E0CD0A|nr:uncharacterized protein LOC128997769 isoform X2 [Macrosteles quadrilineatus]